MVFSECDYFILLNLVLLIAQLQSRNVDLPDLNGGGSTQGRIV